jgi:hypothetical protein
VLNQINIYFLPVHVFFLLDLTYVLKYETIYWLTIHVDYIVSFAL